MAKDVGEESLAVELPLSEYISLFPETQPSDILGEFPSLSKSQVGHIRHFHNLANLPDGEWQHMGSPDPGQESFEAYRYQLATMAYAAGTAHYHRLPALRSLFRRLIEQLIQKMMRRDVWGYWFLTSHSGTFVDPDITELRKPWPNPVKRENIMYSGHLLLMVSLHGMLFDSDKYEEPEALVFDWDPMFWGMGPEKFAYTRSTLQEVILNEMQGTGWLGACCEPNCIFIVCNQFPLIAMRYNDIRNGTTVVDGVLDEYLAAWRSKNGGFTAEGKRFPFFYQIKQDRMIPNESDVGISAWTSAFMNSWNSGFIRGSFSKFIQGFLTTYPDGRINLNSAAVASAIRSISDNQVEEDISLNPVTSTPEMFVRAQKQVEQDAKRLSTGASPMGDISGPTAFGYVVQWVSEVSSSSQGRENSHEDIDLLEGLLQHADTFLNPSWEHGGLFYPRKNNSIHDKTGNWVGMGPYTGNAAIGYGRLNVPDGQKKMWEKPWSKEDHHAKYPYIEGVDLSSDVDFYRGEWSSKQGALVVTMKAWDCVTKRIRLEICNLPVGVYGIYHFNKLTAARKVNYGDVAIVEVEVTNEEANLVLMKQRPF